MKKVRESNFELLRCILMLMVVVVHYNNDAMGKAFTYVAQGSLNYYFVYFIESLAIIGTNGFVLLTGYFSWRGKSMSLRKPLGLLLYVIAYSVLFCIINGLVLQTPFSIKTLVFSCIPNNWYITLYVVLILLKPYINVLLEKLNKKQYFILLVMMFCFFSIWPTVIDVLEGCCGIYLVGMNTIAVGGSNSGYSIVNFILLYLIGAGISKYDLFTFSIKWDILYYLLMTGIIFLQEIALCAGWSYANPFVIMSCVSFFNIFRKLRIRSNIINTLSKAALGVFLIHTQYTVCGYAWSLCDIAEACQGSVWLLGMNMLLCCVITYMLCTIFDMFCRWLTKPISEGLDRCSLLNKKIVSF